MCKSYIPIMKVKRKAELTDKIISGLLNDLPEEGRERYWRAVSHELGQAVSYVADKVSKYKKRAGLSNV